MGAGTAYARVIEHFGDTRNDRFIKALSLGYIDYVLSGVPADGIAGFLPGAKAVNYADGSWYRNTGTSASATWTVLGTGTITLQAAFAQGKIVSGANSSANAVQIGDGTDAILLYRNAADDVRIGTSHASNLVIIPAGGALNVTATLGVSGDFAINTNKFTVTAVSGNTLIAGTGSVTGDFAVNTNKFTVAAASGNTIIAGTGSVTGDFAVNTNKFTVAAATGNTVIAGTLAVTGNISGTFVGTFNGTWASSTWAANPTITVSATDATGVLIDGSSVTTGDILRLLCDASLTSGYFLRCRDSVGNVDKLLVAEDGSLAIFGTALGSDAIAITTGDITLTSGVIEVTAGSIDLLGRASNDDLLDITRSNTATGGAGIDIAMGTAAIAGNAIQVAWGGAGTGDGLSINMTNNVEGTAVALTGVGVRTDRLVKIADSSGAAGAETVYIAKSAGAASMVLLDNNGVAGADTLEIDHDGQVTGRGLYIHGAAWTGTASEGLVDVSTSGAGVPAGILCRLVQGCNGQHAAAISGSALYISDAATAPGAGTSYAVTISATNIEALNVAVGKALFAEEATFTGGIDMNAGVLRNSVANGTFTIRGDRTAANAGAALTVETHNAGDADTTRFTVSGGANAAEMILAASFSIRGVNNEFFITGRNQAGAANINMFKITTVNEIAVGAALDLAGQVLKDTTANASMTIQSDLTAANAGTAITVKTHNAADADTTRITLTGGANQAVLTLAATTLNLGDNGLYGSAVANGDLNLYATSHGTVTTAYIVANSMLDATADGAATKVIAGAVGDPGFTATPVNGLFAIDSTNFRWYFRYGAAWHYCAQTAGVQIPADEVKCPKCKKTMKVGDRILARVDRKMSDGALHALWEHEEC